MAINPRKLSLTFLILLVASGALYGEGTRTWEQSKFDDLSKGTPKGVAVRSTGGLELAPAFKPVSTTPSTYIWSIATDSSGVIYAATGAPAQDDSAALPRTGHEYQPACVARPWPC